MSGIKAVNSKNIIVENSIFSGYETSIELDNVEGFISKNNRFSGDSDPRVLLSNLLNEIINSSLDETLKELLTKEIIFTLSGEFTPDKKKSVVNSLLKYVGDKAADLFVQLVAAVVAGWLLKVRLSNDA